MNDSRLDALLYGISIGAIPVLFAITLHEVAHGWAARQRGDRTAEMLGRLSLNPIRHIDPVGTLVVPLALWLFSGFVFGWAKPVPIGVRNLNNPKRDMIFVAFAGPLANFAMALVWAVLLKLAATGAAEPGPAAEWLIRMANIGIFFNILLGVFNLIPIPPLDGSRMLRGVVSESVGQILDRIEPFGLIIIVLLLWSGLLWVVLEPMYLLVQSLIAILVRL
jgi:Zn-dependent protease